MKATLKRDLYSIAGNVLFKGQEVQIKEGDIYCDGQRLLIDLDDLDIKE
jgi:hypothetical protein